MMSEKGADGGGRAAGAALVPIPESDFPTILYLRDRLSELIDNGFGELPVQLVVVPDSTLQAIARTSGGTPDGKPALMIDLVAADGGGGMPVALISVGCLGRGRMATTRIQ